MSKEEREEFERNEKEEKERMEKEKKEKEKREKEEKEEKIRLEKVKQEELLKKQQEEREYQLKKQQEEKLLAPIEDPEEALAKKLLEEEYDSEVDNKKVEKTEDKKEEEKRDELQRKRMTLKPQMRNKDSVLKKMEQLRGNRKSNDTLEALDVKEDETNEKKLRVQVPSKLSNSPNISPSSKTISNDPDELLPQWEWEDIVQNVLFGVEMNFVMETYDPDEELSKIEVVEQPATFYFPPDEYLEVFTNGLYRIKDNFEYDVNYEEAERMAMAGRGTNMDDAQREDDSRRDSKIGVNNEEQTLKYQQMETKLAEMELENNVLQKTLERYKKLVERGGVSGTTEDVEQLKVILENTKIKVKEVTNKKDNEIHSLKVEIRKKEEDLEKLFKRQKVLQVNFETLDLETKLLKENIEGLKIQNQEKANIIKELQSNETSSIPIRLQKLLSLEQELEDTKIELEKYKKETEGLKYINSIIEKNYEKHREDLKINVDRLDEYEAINKQLKDDYDQIKDELKEANQAYDQLRQARRRDEQTIERNEDSIKKNKQTITQLRNEVKELNDKIEVLEKTIKDLNSGKEIDSTGQLKIFKEKVQNLESDKKRLDLDAVEVSNKFKEKIRQLQTLNDKLNTDLVSTESKLKEEQEKQAKSQRDFQTQAILNAQKSAKNSTKQYNEIKEKLDQKLDQITRLNREVEELRENLKKKSKVEINLNNELNNVKDTLRRTTHEKVDLEFKITDLEEKLTKLSQGQRVDTVSNNTQEKKKVEKIQNNIKNDKKLLVDPGKKITKEDLECFPVLALKKGILNVVSYFEENVEQTKLDIKDLGNGKKHPEIIEIVKGSILLSLNYLFKNGYYGISWFGNSHHWDLFEEVSHLYEDGGQENLKLQMAVETSINHVNEYMKLNYLPNGMIAQDAKFNSFVIHCLNQGLLQTLIKHVVLHPEQINKHYKIEATIRNNDQQKKLFKFLGLISMLPFQLDPLCFIEKNE